MDTPALMLPLLAWAVHDRANLAGVFTDIDDTLTDHGAIGPAATRAIADLAAAGLHVVPVTGRPIGWSEPFARDLVVEAIVAENGGAAWVRTAAGGIEKVYPDDAPTRRDRYARLQAAAQRVLREVPGATLARDSTGRETDIAIDHSEFAHLPQQAIDTVVAVLRDEGLHATVSSIHINGWLGAHDKFSGACWIARRLWGIDLAAQLDRWAYVGDSTNDQAMFARFAHSIGVANIARFVPRMAQLPRYVADAERGAGFAEVAAAILAAR
ncbi:HAD-IIB family hydrolase [Xylophilus sp.]|uniref:HAD-IIB family hydrolase n=1 Tax=Xylophilus sp. TaxID=2653893 RepID=UPI0013BD0A5E|nr:HAD-IIB family hydrolase [Xylophilus sp.]KAF1047905.1 MAG: Mannosyl-3-phosphoglycerate phosphatase [Xylophilus sp.]